MYDHTFCPIQLTNGAKKLELGWDISLREPTRRATTKFNHILGFNLEGNSNLISRQDVGSSSGSGKDSMEKYSGNNPIEGLDGKKRLRVSI
ncbi:hypothetical protein Goshw_004181 [Gossypium schwendimanii]|uniref:Uncharacterized protein n=1 Tax=Gossypium schwendimanii TaxID=34291 RepID=A0A7J9MS60_GOSSC|nr:hypothetical protein [Gossypium schwendimanii]